MSGIVTNVAMCVMCVAGVAGAAVAVAFTCLWENVAARRRLIRAMVAVFAVVVIAASVMLVALRVWLREQREEMERDRARWERVDEVDEVDGVDTVDGVRWDAGRRTADDAGRGEVCDE